MKKGAKIALFSGLGCFGCSGAIMALIVLFFVIAAIASQSPEYQKKIAAMEEQEKEYAGKNSAGKKEERGEIRKLYSLQKKEDVSIQGTSRVKYITGFRPDKLPDEAQLRAIAESVTDNDLEQWDEEYVFIRLAGTSWKHPAYARVDYKNGHFEKVEVFGTQPLTCTKWSDVISVDDPLCVEFRKNQ